MERRYKSGAAHDFTSVNQKAFRVADFQWGVRSKEERVSMEGRRRMVGQWERGQRRGGFS
jgi:hypothetical protein